MLKPNEAMMEDALRFASDSGDGSGKEKKKKIGVLATFAPTITSITKELEELMATTGTSVEIVTRHNMIAALGRTPQSGLNRGSYMSFS